MLAMTVGNIVGMSTNVKHVLRCSIYAVLRVTKEVGIECQVLFTTRKRVPANGLVPLEISLLPPEVARELLTRTRLDLQSETEEADETCRVLGYLPLALELAAAFLAKKPKASLRSYRESLRDRGADATHAQSSLKTADLDAYYAASLTPALEAQWGPRKGLSKYGTSTHRAIFEPFLSRT